MQAPSKQVLKRAERIVALFVFDHPDGCSHRSVLAALDDLDRITVENALVLLHVKGIIGGSGSEYWPSGCVRHLHALDLIAV
jgi:hypothetical protein